MLSAALGVPADAEQLTIWFSYRTTMGAVVHDSDFGANYWFGFPGRDIDAPGGGGDAPSRTRRSTASR